MLFFGPFFFLVYGTCNGYTALRPDVREIAFGWEQHIPFVPALILPYMSIDVFFAASVFLCRTRRELDIHARRIIAAILVSAAGFLLFPLKFTFPHPPVAGWNGMLFNLLTGFDQPYNQAPALHISLLVLLWVKYAAHLSSRWCTLLHAWFVLIAISVLGVYQHHVIDVISGFSVGVGCLYLFPDRRGRRFGFRADRISRRIGLRYALGAVFAGAAACLLTGWGWILLWPAGALAIVAAGYFHFGPSVFRRQAQGGRDWPATLLLLPYLIGARVSAWVFLRRQPACYYVEKGVAVGGRRALSCHAWQGIVAMAPEMPSLTPLAMRYLHLPVLDLTVPPPVVLRRGLRWLGHDHDEGEVCLNCALGLSRSATLAAAWLVYRGQAENAGTAFRQLQQANPRIVWSAAHETAVMLATTCKPQSENGIGV
jgi:membrane-associated phospholipid phosphatase